LRAALQAGVYLAKPNLRELRELTSAPLPDLEAQISACRELIENGQAEIVTLTLGDQGALLAMCGRTLRARPIPIQPVSSVGAGDSFVGAMVWALANELSLEDAFRYAMAAGSAALLTPGTELCKKEDIERLYREVHLSPA
jgi:6-phosphofructokinase 2